MMKRLLTMMSMVILLMVFCKGTFAEQKAEDILKAVVKVRAVIRDNAFTAPLLGTEREGNGVGDDHGQRADGEAVDQPEKHPAAEQREHAHRQVAGRARAPDLHDLRQEGDGGQRAGGEADEVDRGHGVASPMGSSGLGAVVSAARLTMVGRVQAKPHPTIDRRTSLRCSDLRQSLHARC